MSEPVWTGFDGPWFEDFTPGRVFRTGGITLTESQIIDFGLRYDPQPFHIDTVAAEDTVFKGIAASGFHTLSIVFRAVAQTGLFAAANLAGGGLDELRWIAPVRPGDTLHVDLEVVERRPSASKPDRGLIRFRYTGITQTGQRVITFIANQIVAKRPPAAPPGAALDV